MFDDQRQFVHLPRQVANFILQVNLDGKVSNLPTNQDPRGNQQEIGYTTMRPNVTNSGAHGPKYEYILGWF